ncbi:MAG: FAD-binding oxidoreductase [Chloroflexi bacterium]|nr:FAD-binding oxidoreductase [Chloroflexota bacterium]
MKAYEINGVLAQETCHPATPQALAGMLADAAARGQAVVPWGGGTQMGLGYPPRAADLVVATGSLNRLLEHSPADLTATVEAGMTLAELQRALAPHGQRVALEAPLPERATLGGILAVAGAGPRRLGFGRPRDQVLGIRVAHPDGTLTRAGGKVVKNVTGYDLTRLYIGSLGSLGVIVEASFRLAPLPQATITLLLPAPEAGEALALVRRLQASLVQPQALDLVSPSATRLLGQGAEGWLVALELAGSSAAVERQAREAEALADELGRPLLRQEGQVGEEFWAGVRDFGFGNAEPWLTVRSAAPPAQLGTLLEATQEAVTACGIPEPALMARAGNGLLYAFWLPKDLSAAAPASWSELVGRVRAAATSLGGSTVVEVCPPALKQALDLWGPAPAAVAIMRRLKEQFDPKGVLNPGRYLGGL